MARGVGVYYVGARGRGGLTAYMPSQSAVAPAAAGGILPCMLHERRRHGVCVLCAGADIQPSYDGLVA